MPTLIAWKRSSQHYRLNNGHRSTCTKAARIAGYALSVLTLFRTTPGLMTYVGSNSCLSSHMSSYAFVPHSISTNGATFLPVPCSPCYRRQALSPVGTLSFQSSLYLTFLTNSQWSSTRHTMVTVCLVMWTKQSMSQRERKASRVLLYT